MSQPSTQHFPYLRWQYTMSPQFPINSTAISADGSRCVAATFQGAYGTPPPPSNDYYLVNCWDRTGKLLWSDKFQAFEGPFAVAISGDGSIVAAGGHITKDQGYAKVYDAASGNELVTYNFDHRVNTLALSQDGSVLAIGENDAHLAQQSKGVFPTVPQAVGLSAGTIVESISMPDDGSVVVLGDHGGNVTLVENKNGKPVKPPFTWAGGAAMGPVHCVAISADGSWFVAVGDSQDIYLFDLASIKQKQFVTSLSLATSNRLRWVAISGDGSFISTVENVNENGLVYAIKNDNGKLSTLWAQPAKTKSNPNCVSTDAAGKYVAVATGYNQPHHRTGEFCLFDGATGKSLWQYQTPKMAWPCFISADGSGMFAGSDYGVAYYFTPTAQKSRQKAAA